MTDQSRESTQTMSSLDKYHVYDMTLTILNERSYRTSTSSGQKPCLYKKYWSKIISTLSDRWTNRYTEGDSEISSNLPGN